MNDCVSNISGMLLDIIRDDANRDIGFLRIPCISAFGFEVRAGKGYPMDSCSPGKAVFSLCEPGAASITYEGSDQIGILQYKHTALV